MDFVTLLSHDLASITQANFIVAAAVLGTYAGACGLHILHSFAKKAG